MENLKETNPPLRLTEQRIEDILTQIDSNINRLHGQRDVWLHLMNTLYKEEKKLGENGSSD